jgi:hypothetical protein
MNLFRKMIGSKGPGEPPETDLAEEIREMAKREDAAALEDDRSGLVAIYPELGASRRKRRGFADLDFDDYVPELDDYEPGAEGEFLPAEDAGLRPHQATPRPVPHTPVAAPPLSSVPMPHVTPVAPPPAFLADPYARPADAPLPRDTAPEDGAAASLVQVPGPAIGRGGARRAGRVKTRLLGFDSSIGAGTDPFEAGAAPTAAVVRFPVGWIVVVDGPGRGASFTLFNGVSAIGRGDDQPVKLDFGDTSISRTNHAVVAYDNEQRKFFLGHGGKANIVRLNGKPVLSTEELGHNDIIRIGETTLRFLALCGADFDWTDGEGTQDGDAGRE